MSLYCSSANNTSFRNSCNCTRSCQFSSMCITSRNIPWNIIWNAKISYAFGINDVIYWITMKFGYIHKGTFNACYDSVDWAVTRNTWRPHTLRLCVLDSYGKHCTIHSTFAPSLLKPSKQSGMKLSRTARHCRGLVAHTRDNFDWTRKISPHVLGMGSVSYMQPNTTQAH